jgi:cell division ATPase FtsA
MNDVKEITRKRLNELVEIYRREVKRNGVKQKWRSIEIAMAVADAENIVRCILIKRGYKVPSQ